MLDTTTKLELKEKTLIAWARILYKEGIITLAKYNKMIAKFEKLVGGNTKKINVTIYHLD